MTNIEKIVNEALYEMYAQGTVNGSANATDKIVNNCLSKVKKLNIADVSNCLVVPKNKTERNIILSRAMTYIADDVEEGWDLPKQIINELGTLMDK